MIHENILTAIGSTPVVRLQRIGSDLPVELLIKVESLNPSGSVKARTAYWMLESAERAGLLKPDSLIVEPTSGNQGIALAMAAAVKGYEICIIMPEGMSIERQRMMGAYGARVVLTPRGKNIKETFERCIQAALDMKARDERVFIPQQFENPANPDIHRRSTAVEIISQVPSLDAFVAGVGTGGTLTGVGEILKAVWPKVQVVAVEPSNAAVLSGEPVKGDHRLQGIGDGFIPEVLNTEIIDEVITVSDEDAFAITRELARKEGLLGGPSGGAAVCAALQLARRLPSGSRILTLLPDTGERYLSTDLYESSGGNSADKSLKLAAGGN